MRARLQLHRLCRFWMAGLILGCATPTDPGLRSFIGIFVLQSIDGIPAPVLQFEDAYTRQYLVTDTVAADGRGHYTRVMVTEFDSTGSNYRLTRRTVSSGTYAIRNDTLDFAFRCPMGALCIAAPVGWRRADGGLDIAQRYTDGFHLVQRLRHVE